MSKAYILVVVGLISWLAGCGFLKLDEVLPDSRKEYKKAESLPDLEVPPDLTSEAINDSMAVPEVNSRGTATFSTYRDRVSRSDTADQSYTPEQGEVALGDEQVVVASGTLAQVWEPLREFWLSRGFELNLDDSKLGVLETKWREDKDGITRHQFKIFGEPGSQAGTTALFISHKGEELSPAGEELTWVERPRDEVLEKRVAAELRASLPSAATVRAPVADQSARPGSATNDRRAKLIDAGDGKHFITLYEEFSSAWRSTALALENAGLEIDDKNRDRGIYYVSYAPEQAQEKSEKKSMWSKLAFWKGGKQKYLISVTGVGRKTEIVVLDKDGRWDESAAAENILSMVHSQLQR